METEVIGILKEIATSYNLDHNEIVKKYSTRIKTISNDFEDPEIHTRCKGKNKNGKRCSKTKKESSEYCAIHYSQYKEKDTEFLPSSDIEKKKGGILKKILAFIGLFLFFPFGLFSTPSKPTSGDQTPATKEQPSEETPAQQIPAEETPEEIPTGEETPEQKKKRQLQARRRFLLIALIIGAILLVVIF